MERKKYEFTDVEINWKGHILHRIKALKNFGTVQKGDLGGFIEKEKNLSQYDTCWVYDNAKVYDNAQICDKSFITEDAEVFDNAYITEEAGVSGNAKIFENAVIAKDSMISGDAKIYGNAITGGYSNVRENAQVYGKTRVADAEVYGFAKLHGEFCVTDNAVISGNAEIKKYNDYFVFQKNWGKDTSYGVRHITWTKSNDMWREGRFYGNSEELIKHAYEESEENGRYHEATVKYAEALKI